MNVVRKVFLFFVLSLLVLGAFLFAPAGTLDYWQAWLYMAVLFIPMAFALVYFLWKNDPEFMKERMKLKEKVPSQKKIIGFSRIAFFIGLLIPGLDHRFGWSQVPYEIVIAANAIVFLGYVLVFLTLKENRYASRIVEVQKGQKVISTGPYSAVRHPMYTGVIALFLATPIALGSYWALLVFFPVTMTILLRIFDEERLLLLKLPGYRAYYNKVRYRLVPFVW